MSEGRTLPHSLEAERSVLGAILLHPRCLDEVRLTPEEFFRRGHAAIFRAFLALDNDGTAIDLTTVREALKTAGALDEAGGPAYIASLVDGMPKSTNVEHYAAIVSEKARLRAAIVAANAILDEAYQAEDDAADVIGRAEARIRDLSTRGAFLGPKRLSEILPTVLEQIEAWRAAPGGVTGAASGLIDLDELLRGFQPATLNIIAARPAMGKSALAENIARQAGMNGLTSLTFSLEMADEEYALRALASQAHVDNHRIQGGYINEREMARLGVAFAELGNLPMFIHDDPFVTVQDVRSIARRVKAQHGLDVVIVDYTQLMLSSKETENRAIEVGNITRGLKGLSKELNAPVVALAQLNRGLESREDKRPRLSDLRDSGRIEEDADVVLFIYRDDYYHDDTEEPGIAELIVAKHRRGPLGTVKVRWVKEETRFQNLERYQPAAEDRMLPMGDRA